MWETAASSKKTPTQIISNTNICFSFFLPFCLSLFLSFFLSLQKKSYTQSLSFIHNTKISQISTTKNHKFSYSTYTTAIHTLQLHKVSVHTTPWSIHTPKSVTIASYTHNSTIPPLNQISTLLQSGLQQQQQQQHSAQQHPTTHTEGYRACPSTHPLGHSHSTCHPQAASPFLWEFTKTIPTCTSATASRARLTISTHTPAAMARTQHLARPTASLTVHNGIRLPTGPTT